MVGPIGGRSARNPTVRPYSSRIPRSCGTRGSTRRTRWTSIPGHARSTYGTSAGRRGTRQARTLLARRTPAGRLTRYAVGFVCVPAARFVPRRRRHHTRDQAAGLGTSRPKSSMKRITALLALVPELFAKRRLAAGAPRSGMEGAHIYRSPRSSLTSLIDGDWRGQQLDMPRVKPLRGRAGVIGQTSFGPLGQDGRLFPSPSLRHSLR